MLELTVNDEAYRLDVPPHAPLLNVLRNDLRLNGPKYGCGLGQCGSCTVLVDGIAARSCVIPVAGVAGRRITTLEGLPRWSPDGIGPNATSSASIEIHPIQQAYIDEQAAQCGYCLNGMVMSTAALLARNPHPTEQEVRRELSHNLCRCGTHLEILKAVQRAAVLLAPHRHTGGSPSTTSADATTGASAGAIGRIVTAHGPSDA